ncbi:MAG TPA: glycosyltransferase family 39 protein [Candidatus Binataceae bacterium]|nr:glycosyltransferase family 39 protein [Candidatus Binataceae bacterium]
MTGDSQNAIYILGSICGLAIFALVASAIAITIRPLIKERDRTFLTAIVLLFVIAIIKIALIPSFPGYLEDIKQFKLWASVLASLGPGKIYDPEYACKYTPAYLYALWPAGVLASAFGTQHPEEALHIGVEIPLVLADFILAILAYAVLRRSVSAHLALIGTILLAINPAFIYTSLSWGQNDAVLTTLILLSVMLVAESRFAMGWAVAVIAALTKGQGLLMLPLLGIWTLACGRREDWLRSAGAALIAAIIVIAPFQFGHSWTWMFDLYAASFGWFPRATANAFNLMYLLGGLWSADSATMAGISYFALGAILMSAAILFAGYVVWRRPEPSTLMFSVFFAYLAMFVLGTRIHERYLYFAAALIVPLLFESRASPALYAVLTATLLFNLIYARMALEGQARLGPHDSAATLAAIANVGAIVTAALWGIFIASPPGLPSAQLPPIAQYFFSPPDFAKCK